MYFFHFLAAGFCPKNYCFARICMGLQATAPGSYAYEYNIRDNAIMQSTEHKAHLKSYKSL